MVIWLVVSKIFLIFIPYKFGEMIQFDKHIFQMGWNQQPATLFQLSFCDKRGFGKFVRRLSHCSWPTWMLLCFRVWNTHVSSLRSAQSNLKGGKPDFAAGSAGGWVVPKGREFWWSKKCQLWVVSESVVIQGFGGILVTPTVCRSTKHMAWIGFNPNNHLFPIKQGSIHICFGSVHLGHGRFWLQLVHVNCSFMLSSEET